MTEADEKLIRLIVKDVATEAAEKALKLHIQLCPYGKTIGRSKAFILGGAFALTLIGMGLGAAATKFVEILK